MNDNYLETTSEKCLQWLISFQRCDPRWRILNFFCLMAERGGKKRVSLCEIQTQNIMSCDEDLTNAKSLKGFTVWRPTSLDAIRKMMSGDAVGKGLNVKGKSAKRGALSGFIPFMQIHSNDGHKTAISMLPKDARINVFFKSLESRTTAIAELEVVSREMVNESRRAHRIIADVNCDCDSTYEEALTCVQKYDMEDPAIKLIDDYDPQCYGINIPERLFWEAFVVRRDTNRPKGSSMDTGRPSEPAFQDMNFVSTREKKPKQPKTVVLQAGGHDDDDPLCPLTLLVAYEENGRVLPVASDFDAFLIGTKGLDFKKPLPPEQIEILKWCVNQIERVLEDRSNRRNSWTTNWLEVLKSEAQRGFSPKIPTLGFGDPKSYKIMKYAVKCLKGHGSVRHGAECFNYYFPQELDKEFLVFSGEGLGDNVKWKYLNLEELQQFLLGRIEKGFVFPLNPKWVLCDRGWKEVYDRLHASADPQVQMALRAWYPPESGIRERMECVYRRHPNGYVRTTRITAASIIHSEGTALMDLAELKLNRFLALQSAKRKLRVLFYWIKLAARHEKMRRSRSRLSIIVNSRSKLMISSDSTGSISHI